jgi:aminopeptidase N
LAVLCEFQRCQAMTKSILKCLTFILFFATSCAVGLQKRHQEEVYSVEKELSDEPTSRESIRGEVPAARAKYHATETVLTDLIHTKLEVNFDWPRSRMNGIAYLTAKPHFYDSDSLILDAKGMDILGVSLGDKELTYTYASDILKIKLDKSYKKSESYTVKIAYIAKPDERETAGSAAISSDKGLYFINPKGKDSQKMPQIWTQGETESNSVWFPTVDAPAIKTSQEIYLTVDNKFTTLSNGLLISSKVNSDGTRTDYWKQSLPHAPYLFMMAVGEFKVIKDLYTRLDGSKMEVNYYVEPEWEQRARAIFGETSAMISFFSKLLGVEYPWDKYSQIVVRDYVSGAMENTGAVVFGDFVYKTERELLDENDQATIAHELFHHWFGDLVTAESWSNLTLNESFANYSQYLWDEHRYGLDEAAYQAEIEEEGYFQASQGSGYHDLVWFDYDDKDEMFDSHSYNKGGRILHMLRNYLGDEAFFSGINRYLKSNQYKAAEFHQLRLAFEEVCGEDLNWFFNQWYLAAGHPILDVTQLADNSEKTVSVRITQSQNLEVSPVYKLPIEIAVFDSEGKHTHKVVIDNLTETFTFSYSGTLNCVIVDDQQVLLAKKREEKSAEQYVFQYYHSKTYKARKEGLLLGSKAINLQTDSLVLAALKDDFWHIRELAIGLCSKLQGDFKTQGMKIVEGMSVNDPRSGVRAAAIGFLSKNIEGKELENILVNRLEKDSSYFVVSTALVALGKLNPEVAKEKAKLLEKESSSSLLVGIGQIYSGHGGVDAFSFFEHSLKGNVLKGYDQVGMMNSFTIFCTRQDIAVIEKAVPIYEHLGSSGFYYTKMFFQQNIAYFQKYFEAKRIELNEELVGYEKNRDFAYADQVRTIIKRYDAVSAQFESLKKAAVDK